MIKTVAHPVCRMGIRTSWVMICVLLSCVFGNPNVSAANPGNFRSSPRRVLDNQITYTNSNREKIGAERKNRKKENIILAEEDESKDKDKNKDRDEDKDKDKNKETTQYPTIQPSQVQLPSLEFPSQPPSAPATNNSQPIMNSTTTIEPVEVELLPFSLLVHGSISLEDELVIRRNLQDYLLNSAEEMQQQLDLFRDALRVNLELIQTVESYFQSDSVNGYDNGDNSTGENDNRNRLLQINGSASTSSTLLQYQASTVVKYEADPISNERIQLALQDNQIEALEDVDELQGYFLKRFTLGQQTDVNADLAANEDESQSATDILPSEQNPVVLIEVQVADFPAKSLDFKETWQSINSIILLESSSIANTANTGDDQIGVEEGSADKKASNPWADEINKLDQSVSNNGISSSTWKVAAGIIGAAMVLTGLAILFCVRRFKRRQISSKERKCFSGEADDHAMEIIGSNEHSTINDKSAVCAEDPRRRNTGRSNTFFFSEILRIGKQQNGTTKSVQDVSCHATNTKTKDCEEQRNEKTETDSVNTNTFASNKNSFDYSNRENTTEENQSLGEEGGDVDLTVPVARNSNRRQGIEDGHPPKKSSFLKSFFQKSSSANETKETLQATYESNPYAGKVDISNETSNDDDSMMGYSLTSLPDDPNHQVRHHDDNNTMEDLDETMSLASSESETPNPMFAGIHKVMNMPTRTDNSANPMHGTVEIGLQMKSRRNNQHYDSKGILGDIEHENEESSSINATFLDDDDTNEGELSSVMSGFSSAGKTDCDSEDIENGNGLVLANDIEPERTTHIRDDASDAPSDELNDNFEAALPGRLTARPVRFPDANTDSIILDDDPAIVEYIVKNERSLRDDTRKGLRNQKQSQFTMEV